MPILYYLQIFFLTLTTNLIAMNPNTTHIVNSPQGQAEQGGRGGCTIIDMHTSTRLLQLTPEQLHVLNQTQLEEFIAQGVKKYREFLANNQRFIPCGVTLDQYLSESSTVHRVPFDADDALAAFSQLHKIGETFQVAESPNPDFAITDKKQIIEHMQRINTPTCAIFTCHGESQLICRNGNTWSFFDSHRQSNDDAGASIRVFSTLKDFNNFFMAHKRLKIGQDPADVTIVQLIQKPTAPTHTAAPATPVIITPLVPAPAPSAPTPVIAPPAIPVPTPITPSHIPTPVPQPVQPAPVITIAPAPKVIPSRPVVPALKPQPLTPVVIPVPTHPTAPALVIAPPVTPAPIPSTPISLPSQQTTVTGVPTPVPVPTTPAHTAAPATPVIIPPLVPVPTKTPASTTPIPIPAPITPSHIPVPIVIPAQPPVPIKLAVSTARIRALRKLDQAIVIKITVISKLTKQIANNQKTLKNIELTLKKAQSEQKKLTKDLNKRLATKQKRNLQNKLTAVNKTITKAQKNKKTLQRQLKIQQAALKKVRAERENLSKQRKKR